MALEIYDISVPVFRRTLRALLALTTKAEAHCAARGVDPGDLLAGRLAPDMHPLAFQFAAAINNSVGALARLRGLSAPHAEAQASLEAIAHTLADAVAGLEALTPADLAGAAEREIVLPHPRGDRVFTGQGYLLSLALPGFFFHAATAYDLLRHQGLEIGKRDFLGELPPRRPPS